jgi:hypothetical protein
MEIKSPVTATISAKVFRVKSKPRYIPNFIYKFAKKRRWSIAGKWEDMGVVTETEI